MKPVILVLLLASACSADVIFSNLTGFDMNGTAGVAGGNGSGSTIQEYAAGFTPSMNYSVVDAQALLKAATSVAPAAPITASLFSDQGGVPSSLIGTLSSVVVSTFQTYTFTSSNPISLTANTPYWLVLSAAVASQADWFNASDNSPGAYRLTQDSVQESWTNFLPVQFEIDGTPTAISPEPALMGLVAMGCAGCIAWARKRTKR